MFNGLVSFNYSTYVVFRYKSYKPVFINVNTHLRVFNIKNDHFLRQEVFLRFTNQEENKKKEKGVGKLKGENNVNERKQSSDTKSDMTRTPFPKTLDAKNQK